MCMLHYGYRCGCDFACAYMYSRSYAVLCDISDGDKTLGEYYMKCCASSKILSSLEVLSIRCSMSIYPKIVNPMHARKEEVKVLF